MHNFIIIYSRRKSIKRSIRLTGAVAIVLAWLAGSCFNVQGQTGQTIYFMDRLPQSSLLNPSFQHAHNLHIGLPMISSFNVEGRTNFVNFSDLIFQHPRYDSLISFLHPDANPEDFTSKLRNRNIVASDLHLNILSFGFRVNEKSFASFNLTERSSGSIVLPRDLLMLGVKGNEQFVDKKADFSGLGAGFNYFREYAAGYSYLVDERLQVGARGKLLFGKANLSSVNQGTSLYTDPHTYDMRMRSEFTLNVSMPLHMDIENGDIEDIRFHFDNEDYDPRDFIFGSNNAGFAVDLGATYQLTEPVTLYASITDLGFISWKEDTYNISVNGDYEFEGIDFSSSFDSSDDSDPFENFLDTLSGRFNITATDNSYRRGLPARIYLGGTYQLHPLIGVGVLSRSEITRNRIGQAVTLSANTNVGRRLSASLSYSAMNNSYNNLGLGLSFRGALFQFFMVSDNLNSAFMPHRTSSVNLWFGFNMMFGHRKTADPGINQPEKFDVPLADPGTDDPDDDDQSPEKELPEDDSPAVK